MKKIFLDLMEKTLSAYSTEHVLEYFARVKSEGLTEHGFPRLTANIGILVSHGRRTDLTGTFIEMMDFCCNSIPVVRAANDFSVREIVCCIEEAEKSGRFDGAVIKRWKDGMRAVNPLTCYNVRAKSVDDRVKNWALFTGVSEYFRYTAGLGGDMEFIELQVGSQLKWLDENGMYMDNGEEKIKHPTVYDLVARGLFCTLLRRGYRGRYYAEIDKALKKAGKPTLLMQSVNGEIAFGGRSNQFIHNEPWLAATYFYEANRYGEAGDEITANRFLAAAGRALAVTANELDKKPIRHVKNRYDTATGIGCEKYAYFDKYMISVASMLYLAQQICGEADTVSGATEEGIFVPSEHFHKVFINKGGYSVEIELNGDPSYDACGLGRVHRIGAPSVICMSVPCPKKPSYKVEGEPSSLSVCAGIKDNGRYAFAYDADSNYKIESVCEEKEEAFAAVSCLVDDRPLTASYAVGRGGVTVTLRGDGDIALSLPAFSYDGEAFSEIAASENALEIRYGGWACRYETDGTIVRLNRTAYNRNGRYEAYCAEGKNTVSVKITICEGERK